MKKPAFHWALTSILSVTMTLPAFAWGDQGHQIVATIAARNLTSGARAKIAAMIRAVPAAQDDLKLKAMVGASGTPTAAKIEKVLFTIATWPDHMPGGKQETEPWHFIDIGLFEGPSHIAERCAGGDCITQKIADIIPNLQANKPLTRFAPDRELRFLVHFLGDIHQPLHCVTDADAGGNCIRTKNPSGELHSEWDTALVKLATGSSKDPSGAIITAMSSHKAEFQAELDPSKITAETFDFAKTVAYGKAQPAIPVIDHFVDVRPSACATQAPAAINAIQVDAKASYNNAATLDLIRQQLYKGGVRLAAILNGL